MPTATRARIATCWNSPIASTIAGRRFKIGPTRRRCAGDAAGRESALSAKLQSARRLRPEHSHLNEHGREVENPSLVFDHAVLVQPIHEHRRDFDAPACRWDAEELSTVRPRDAAEERDPEVVDDDVFGRENQIRE